MAPTLLPSQLVGRSPYQAGGQRCTPFNQSQQTHAPDAALRIECWQVSSSGIVELKLVSAVGDRGTSKMELSGGKGLGHEGAQRLVELLHVAPPLMLSSLNLRHDLSMCFLFTFAQSPSLA
jgi:hypothetical protein